MAQTRTMAFQISEDLFQRIKDYLAHENERQGRKVTRSVRKRRRRKTNLPQFKKEDYSI